MSMTVSSHSSSVESRLVFVLSAPRSGSTLLMRILNATEEISARSEPHLIPPLAHLGYWECVDQAPYDQLQAQDAMRGFVSARDSGEELYYQACRAYADTLYGAMIQDGGTQFFLDKTPANALVIPFLKRLYPKAHYIVLTRHPAAIFASYVESFFDGDARAASAFNPILSRYIPAVADFLENPPQNLVHVSYEQLVQDPQKTLAQLCSFLDIPMQEEALNYNRVQVEKGLGDPIGIGENSRPVQDSMFRWVDFFHQRPHAQEILDDQLIGVSDDQLSYFGTTFSDLWAPMNQSVERSKKRKSNRFMVERKILIALRRNIHRRPHGTWVKSVRRFCDVLLRG
ncbi:MAG: hypothetical protein CL916_06520 [Deltaproteobacteria bacterium]|nr:hypothetical protein [Deltaproteobacteria bacterium]